MTAQAARALLSLLMALPAAAAVDSEAVALLAKSVAAFEHNLENEKHWNWTISETRDLVDKSGNTLQRFPAVQSESIIMGTGRRCNAVTAWGDHHAVFLKDAPPEERCQAYNALGTPFQVALLLKSAKARITGRTSGAITIAVDPDKPRQKDPDYAIRCAASIEAVIALDSATSFPLRIEGKVVDSGCDANFMPVMHDTAILRTPMATNFHKGSTFRVVYELQKDRFDNAANGFWITTEQHYDQPMSEFTVLYFWGRQFPIRVQGGRRLVKHVTTAAQEFGAGSQLTFK
jgi:hypothetical protein